MNSLSVAKILSDRSIIGTITNQLLVTIGLSQQLNKEADIHNFLDQYLGSVDLKESFNQKLFLIYDEVLYLEILLAIHSWFSTKCCNLKNIVVVTTHTIGADFWYQNYTKMMGVPGLTLVEAPLMSDRYLARVESIPQQSDQLLTKNLKYYFSFYGGSYGSPERDFLAAYFINVGSGWVDYMSGFDSTPVEFENYLEQQTEFSNRQLVDDLLRIRNTATFPKETQVLNELFDFSGYQWTVDKQCAGQVIRETSNTTPWTTVTEKTLRCFIHSQIPIPISGTYSVSNLEKLGFKFDHNIINYDYQNEPILCRRLHLIKEQIDQLKHKYTLKELEKYFIANNELLCYNYNYIASGQIFDRIREKLIRDANG